MMYNLKSIFRRLSFSFSRFISVQTLFYVIQYKFSKTPSFIFNNEELEYFQHSYNNNRLTERAIEIPIVKHYWKFYKPSSVLEIGNVTNHYYSYFSEFNTEKIVVDKYENAFGVINQDILAYKSPIRYPFIFSISTFEHLDSDRGRNQDYIKGSSILSSYAADAIVHVCTNLLVEGGIFVLTAPLGYAVEFDNTILGTELYENLELKEINLYYLKKVSEIEWIQVSRDEVKNPKLNTPLPDVNHMVILEIKK